MSELTKYVITGLIILILVFSIPMYVMPKYRLWAAGYSKKIQVEDALGKKLAAKELADAEIIRAEGIAEANRKKDYSIPEPTEFKIQNLIKKLELFTKINLKPNLARLYSSGCLKTTASPKHNTDSEQREQI